MRQRWQTKRETPGHTDDWLMTYADMITLLLCFFAIFLSISISRQDAPQKVATALTVPLPARPTDVPEGDRPLRGLARADRSTEDSAAKAPAKIDETPAQVNATRADASPGAAGEALAQTTADFPPVSQPEAFDNLISQGPADIEQKGDRITTLEINSAAFFDSGSATLSKPGESILRDMAVKLKSDKFKDFQITVEGHTDDTPINTLRFPSNWELSTARASAVVHFFLDQGIPARKLRAAGYADTFPKVPNRDANGNAIPENQRQNRRVVIKLEKIEKAERNSVVKSDAAFSASISP